MKIPKGQSASKRPGRFTPIEIVMALCLIAAVAYTIYLIFAKFNPYGISSDTALDIIYRRLSWEEKTLFPESYVGAAESMSLRSALLYWLFYAVTHKFLLSYQLENICTFFLLLTVIYCFLTKLKVTRAVKLFSLFFLVTCLSSGVMWVTFWPMNAYVLYVIVTLLTLTLRISLEEAETARGRGWRIGLILLLASMFGYGTVKMILFLYLPMAMLDVIRVLFRYFKREPIRRMDWTLCAVSTAALAVNAIFYALFLSRHSDSIVVPGFAITGMDRWLTWEVLSAQIKMLLMCFGLQAGGGYGQLTGGDTVPAERRHYRGRDGLHPVVAAQRL